MLNFPGALSRSNTGKKFKRSLRDVQQKTEERQCPAGNCNLTLLSSRYAIEFREVTETTSPSVYLFDCAHGIKRKLRIKGNIPHFDCNAQMALIEIKNALLIQSNALPTENCSFSSDEFAVYLLFLNVVRNECTVLSKFNLPGSNPQLIVDSDLSDKFAIITWNKNACNFYKGKLNNYNNLEIDNRIREFSCENLRYESLRLIGNKMHGLSFKSTSIEFFVIFNEFILEPLQIRHRQLKVIKMDQKHGFLLRNFKFHCAWLDNTDKLFVLQFNGVDSYFLNCYNFNTYKITEFGTHKMNKICDILIQYEILIACSFDYETGEHCFHRIALEQPDTLRNLALNKISQQTTHMNAEKYEYFVDQLPLILKPFEKEVIR